VGTTVRVSEVFRSLQGEGPSAGTPAVFVRLQGCSVGCRWCDTKYSWDAAGGRAIERDELWAEAARAPGAAGSGSCEAPLLVITGGEPLEHAGLLELIAAGLERFARVEVETSGVAPPPLSHPRLFYNLSPKLPSATPLAAATWAHARAWIAEPRATFKLVVGDEADLAHALERIAEHGVPRARVMLMPEAMTAKILRERSLWLAAVCAREGLRLSPRLHIWLWGARRGV